MNKSLCCHARGPDLTPRGNNYNRFAYLPALIAKLGAYGFETDALRYMKSYLTNRKQRVRVNKTFSEWERITTGVPQGSILGPLLFNIFLNDLFLFVSNASLSNYADDNTLYTFGDNLKKNKDNLRSSFDTVHQWFYENYMVLNAGKCHFMCLGNNTENETFLFHNILMENSKEQKILGVIIDNKLNFKSQVNYVKRLLRKLQLYLDCLVICITLRKN